MRQTPTVSRPPFVVALLNLTGLGIGYVYLRRWRRWIVHLVLTAILMLIAFAAQAGRSPMLWQTIFGAWLLWMVFDGMHQGRHPSALLVRPARSRPEVVVALGLGLIGFEVVCSWVYSVSAHKEFDAGWLAHQQGDCRSAVQSYDRVTSFYALSFDGQMLEQAMNYGGACGLVNDGETACQEGRFEDGISCFESHLAQFPESVLTSNVRNGIAQCYKDWASQLKQDGDYSQAAAKFEAVLDGYADTPVGEAAAGGIAGVYQEWGNELRGSGDFEAATEKYRAILERFPELGLDGSLRSALAETYMEWGQSLTNTGDYQAALGIYRTIAEEYSGTATASGLGLVVSDLFSRGQQALEQGAACEAMAILEGFVGCGWRFAAEAAESFAEALYQCGLAGYAAADYQDAMVLFQRLIDDYSSSPRLQDAQVALVDARVADIKARGTGELPEPQTSGSAPAGVSEVVISNDSPERLEVLLSGPASQSLIIEPCDTCTTYSLMGPLYCPEKGPQAVIRVVPGTYEVVVRAMDNPGITPWSGTWELASGREYFYCFYIVTSLSW